MKKTVFSCALAVLVAAGSPGVFAQTQAASQYNFGDFRSSTLTAKAWSSMSEKNLDGVLAYTNKCLELYAEQARTMQEGLQDYPAGDDQKIFSFWPLNDVATCLFIQGEAYRQAGQKDKAKAAYESVIKNYSFGQAFDPASKSFWKPAEAAKEKMMMIDKGMELDFGDLSSSYLIRKSWEALSKKDLDALKAYVEKVVELYGATAVEMQASLKEFPWESQEKINSYWALNDVGTALFILGQGYRNAGMKKDAVTTFKKLVNEYYYAQCWDPQGWFWKPAEAAQQQIIELEVQK